MRIFLAHPKNMPDEQIDELKAQASAALSSEVDEELVFVLGREDFAENFATAGGWRGWPRDVIDRIDFNTRRPWYTALLVVPHDTVGKATAEMVEYALEKRKPVLTLIDGVAVQATGIQQIDFSFPGGWALVVARSEVSEVSENTACP